MKILKKFYAKRFAKNLGTCYRLRQVEAIFESFSYNSVLDIGCGDGSFTVRLRKSPRTKLYGIDISEKAIILAKAKGIEAKQTDLNEKKIPFPTNYFDAVYCGEVLEHLYNPDLVLEEIWRVLKKSGKLVLTTPNLAWWVNRIVLLLGYQPYLTEASLKYDVGKFKKPRSPAVGHLRILTPTALLALLEIYNFEILKVATTQVGESLPFPLNIFEAIISSLRPSLGHSIVVVARPNK